MMTDADQELEWLRALRRVADDRADGHVVSELVPEGFPAYVRVFHRWYADEDTERTATWKELARAAGACWHGELMAGALAPARRPEAAGAGAGTFGVRDPEWWVDDGEPDAETRRQLIEILSAVTSPGEPVYFAYELAMIVRGLEPVVWQSTAAGLETVRERQQEGIVGPELWWPADRSWAVCSDYDLTSTYLACDRDLAERLTRSPHIEALPVTPDTRVDRGADTLNRS